MEHRWGHRLSTNIPVRLRCLQARDSGCRCLGRIENVSASGALIITELGICPSAAISVEILTSDELGTQERELPACVTRAGYGELAVEWTELESTAVSALLTEAILTTGACPGASPPAFGRVPFCALAPVTAA